MIFYLFYSQSLNENGIPAESKCADGCPTEVKVSKWVILFHLSQFHFILIENE